MACAELDRNYASITIQSSLACNTKYRAFYNNIDIAFQNFCSIYSMRARVKIFSHL